MRNIEQVNGWYNQALEMSDKLYALMGEIFNDNEIVSYNIEVDRWDSSVNVRVFALICFGKASEELRELAGNFSAQVTFAEYTQKERIDTFIETVATDIKTFARRAGMVRDIVKKDNEK